MKERNVRKKRSKGGKNVSLRVVEENIEKGRRERVLELTEEGRGVKGGSEEGQRAS